MAKVSAISVFLSYDPTRTLHLRNAFEAQMKKRFDELVRVIKKSILEDDCFGFAIQANQMETTGPNRFAFLRSDQKVQLFMQWLRGQVRLGIIGITELDQIGSGIESAWTNLYVRDSYKRGLLRGREELTKVGDIPTIDETGGIDIGLNNPFHMDRLGLLYTRVYSELKGVTDAMDQAISRVLAQGMADGDGPKIIARKVVAVINGKDMGELGITDTLGRWIPAQRRAEMIARTEVIRAHHQATIQEYMNWRWEKVYIQAEVVTAGDKRVCPKCTAMAKGGPYTLEQAMNLIPYHPQCRCVAIPYVKDDKVVEVTPKTTNG